MSITGVLADVSLIMNTAVDFIANNSVCSAYIGLGIVATAAVIFKSMLRT